MPLSPQQVFADYFRAVLKVMPPSVAYALGWNYSVAEERRRAFSAASGVPIPQGLAVSVTTRCQLACPGCPSTAADPTRREMDPSELRSLIAEARAAGVFLFFMLGGEPLLRADLLDLMAEATDSFFFVYTNGLLLDEGLASAYSRYRHILLMLSIEGFREATDRWRGPGTYDALMDRMALLKRHAALFGYSATVTRLNYTEVTSDDFVGAMGEAGCRVAYYSGYMPVGEKAPRQFLLTRSERLRFGLRVQELKQRHDLAFINENLDTDHCMGGSEFIHISPYGDAEPCPAIHLATHNVRQHSLVEIMKGRLMERMRELAHSLSGTDENCVCRSGLYRQLRGGEPLNSPEVRDAAPLASASGR